MDKLIKNTVKCCTVCQYTKHKSKKYGKLPTKQATNLYPWGTVCVDLVGPYTVDASNGTYILNALMMLDPCTRWLEIVEVPRKDSETVALAFDRAWLSCYLRPSKCLHDKGPEFTGQELQEILTSYGIR